MQRSASVSTLTICQSPRSLRGFRPGPLIHQSDSRDLRGDQSSGCPPPPWLQAVLSCWVWESVDLDDLEPLTSLQEGELSPFESRLLWALFSTNSESNLTFDPQCAGENTNLSWCCLLLATLFSIGDLSDLWHWGILFLLSSPEPLSSSRLCCKHSGCGQESSMKQRMWNLSCSNKRVLRLMTEVLLIHLQLRSLIWWLFTVFPVVYINCVVRPHLQAPCGFSLCLDLLHSPQLFCHYMITCLRVSSENSPLKSNDSSPSLTFWCFVCVDIFIRQMPEVSFPVSLLWFWLYNARYTRLG